MRVAIIGLGEIGGAVFDEIAKHINAADIHLIGVDIDPKKLLPHDHYHIATVEFTTVIPVTDIYIVCVWSTEQILSAIKQIEELNGDALICIESTIDPTAISAIQRKNVVAFPHRFNPNDPDHVVFNLDRLMGATNQKALNKAHNFYHQFMDANLIHDVSFETAVYAKVAENAYRAIEIIIAQEIKEACDAKGVDFKALREAMNTKWNIDMRDALHGVGGKCLPKDLALFNKALPEFLLGQLCTILNEEYKRLHSR
jgi:UDP-N-acetyl-D-mannosaminuronate dehydrogenase